MERELYFVLEHRCYIVRWLADLSLGVTSRHWQGLVEHPSFEPGLAALHDARGRKFHISPEEAAAGGEIYRRDVEPRVGFGPLALLVDSEVTHTQATRFTNMLELQDTIVTYSEAEARQWAGLPADHPFGYAKEDVR